MSVFIGTMASFGLQRQAARVERDALAHEHDVAASRPATRRAVASSTRHGRPRRARPHGQERPEPLGGQGRDGPSRTRAGLHWTPRCGGPAPASQLGLLTLDGVAARSRDRRAADAGNPVDRSKAVRQRRAGPPAGPGAGPRASHSGPVLVRGEQEGLGERALGGTGEPRPPRTEERRRPRTRAGQRRPGPSQVSGAPWPTPTSRTSASEGSSGVADRHHLAGPAGGLRMRQVAGQRPAGQGLDVRRGAGSPRRRPLRARRGAAPRPRRRAADRRRSPDAQARQGWQGVSPRRPAAVRPGPSPRRR